MSKPLLFLVGLLISYGSLYPFRFSAAPPDALAHLFSHFHLLSSRGDMLGNIGLFLPWGWTGMAAFRGGRPKRVLATLGWGALLAVLVQIAQLWVPARDAALGDAVWNTAGILLGIALAGLLRTTHGRADATRASTQLMPLLLVTAWVLLQWLPLVPSLDLQLIAGQVRPLLAEPDWMLGRFAVGLATALVLGHLLRQLLAPAWASLAHPLLITGVLWSKPLFVQASIDPSELAGLSLGLLLWPLLQRRRPHPAIGLALSLIVAWSLEALAPYVLADHAQTVQWLPFAALLESSMLNNLRSLGGSLFIYLAALYLVQSATGRAMSFSVGLAVWVAGLELAQILLPGRTPDMTEPLLVLLAGWLCAHGARPSRPPTSAPQPIAPETASAGRLLPWLQLAALVGLLMVAMVTVLRLPGIPYNVQELFRGDGHWAALLMFALALLWTGAGAVWLAARLRAARWPGLALPGWTLLTCWISLALLWAAVSTESIEDISGSSNLFWFVTNKDIWGAAWRELFLWLDAPGAIGFVEHTVRYSALYAPLPVLTALVLLAHDGRWPPERTGRLRVLGLLLGAALLLWLCKSIAFSWSSTDNLNELLARAGPWGLRSGGLWLYLLILLLCANGAAAARAETGLARLGALVFSLALVPLGWSLLNLGLDQQVEKYGQVFSATQFLLGANRAEHLSRELLFLRWGVVQLGAVAVISLGAWLARSLFASVKRKSTA
jgi:VanZ family protein